MKSSTIGKRLKIEVFGESHAEFIGVRISGFTNSFTLDFDKIKLQMMRRAPGGEITSSRSEADDVKIISGVENGVTTGGVIEARIYNTDTRSADYDDMKFTPRPGHADLGAYLKFGVDADLRGGSNFSGRMTAPVVFAGAVSEQYLASLGVKIASHISNVGDVYDDDFDPLCDDENLLSSLHDSRFPLINEQRGEQMKNAVKSAMDDNDSVGGSVECIVTGMPTGVGGALFDGLEGKISQYLFGIPAIKAVEFGAGTKYSKMRGFDANDEYVSRGGRVALKSNNCGGILGGISVGSPIIFKAHFKPTPSIGQPQQSVNLKTGENVTMIIHGRHDPCIVLRACPVVEAAAALALTDAILCENANNDDITSIRSQISAINDDLSALLSRRKECTDKIGEIKQKNGAKVQDDAREAEILRQLPDDQREIFKSIMTFSRISQYRQSGGKNSPKTMTFAFPLSRFYDIVDFMRLAKFEIIDISIDAENIAVTVKNADENAINGLKKEL